MEPWMIMANVLGTVVFFGGIVMCVWFDQRGKTRRREIQHLERMRAIELGRPLDDAAVARYQALGAIGVAVPISSLSAAAIGSVCTLALRESEWRFGALAIIWTVCGTLCGAVVPAVISRLRKQSNTSSTESADG